MAQEGRGSASYPPSSSSSTAAAAATTRLNGEELSGGAAAAAASSSSSRVREEEEESNDGGNHHQFGEADTDHHHIGLFRGNLFVFDDVSAIRDDTWSCVIVVITFWFFG